MLLPLGSITLAPEWSSTRQVLCVGWGSGGNIAGKKSVTWNFRKAVKILLRDIFIQCLAYQTELLPDNPHNDSHFPVASGQKVKITAKAKTQLKFQTAECSPPL